MNDDHFSNDFCQLTGCSALSWQTRLYEKGFASGTFPSVINLSTGLGKTMVMAIWLIARVRCPDKIPTRMIYVVDRRTVVDQATDLARMLQGNCKKALGVEPPAISTLRGQLADNRQWSRDLSRPAIIIGTVDLIGSALLFSGYRSSYKRRPLEAGLLGRDSLLVLDEAHLSRPFEKLLDSIESFERHRDTGVPPVKPMRVIRMSATSGDTIGSKPPFTLQFDATGNLTGEDAEDTILVERFGAKKRLMITTLGEKDKLIDKLAGEADKLASEKPGSRIVIFVKTPDLVKKIRDALKKKNKDHATRIAQLTGTMRGLERDELVSPPTEEIRHECWVMQRFLAPDNQPSKGNCFLISTSAGEVGFDLNADHMVCDATSIDSLIQRLGRVNRRGTGDAQVHVLVEPAKKEKDGKPKKLEGHDLAIANTLKLLDGVSDVSPKNIADLKSGKWKGKYTDACSPAVPTVDLTDILLDAWSLTSITAPMPGRPEVGPWLRGIDDALPQTTIAWRAELDEPGFADLDLEDIEEWFDTHRILTHETLSVPTSVAAKWLTDRWNKLDDKLKSDVGRRPIIVDRSGLKRVTVKEVVGQLRKNSDSIRYVDLTLPASFGGIERGDGLLDAAAPKQPEDAANADEETRKSNAKARLIAPDVADIADGQPRQREIITKMEDGESEHRIVAGGTTPPNSAHFRIELTSDDDRTIRLVSHIPKREKPEYGLKRQTLRQHVGEVRTAIDNILSRISLPADCKLAAQLAADWHDHGKNRERWQRTVDGTATLGTTDWMHQKALEGDGKHQCIGKSGGEMKRDSRSYRHEFGSLREFTDAFNAGTLLDDAGRPISQDVFDLAMHLIAVHHGRGRPHFPKGGFDPDCEPRSDEIHTDAIRRFARLQRKYGWWGLAWLENLLRCADALASADQDAEDDLADAEGDEA